MAKVKNNPSVSEDEPIEEIQQAGDETPVVVVEASASEESEPTVKCQAKEDHECAIGGTKYHLVYGRTYTLPRSVAVILGHANKVIVMS